MYEEEDRRRRVECSDDSRGQGVSAMVVPTGTEAQRRRRRARWRGREAELGQDEFRSQRNTQSSRS